MQQRVPCEAPVLMLYTTHAAPPPSSPWKGNQFSVLKDKQYFFQFSYEFFFFKILNRNIFMFKGYFKKVSYQSSEQSETLNSFVYYKSRTHSSLPLILQNHPAEWIILTSMNTWSVIDGSNSSQELSIKSQKQGRIFLIII